MQLYRQTIAVSNVTIFLYYTGGAGGAGGGGGAGGMPDISQLLQDPEVLAAFQVKTLLKQQTN